jgi:hypothetical protein
MMSRIPTWTMYRLVDRELAGYAVIDAGVGLVMPALAESAMGAVGPHRGGMAGGAVTTPRQLGFAIGIAVLGTVFAARAEDQLASTRASWSRPGSACSAASRS